MANTVANISDLIHRVVTSSCLTHHLPGSNGIHNNGVDDESIEEDDDEEISIERDHENSTGGGGESSETITINTWEEEKVAAVLASVREVESLMNEVFEAVSAVKRAYVSLQGAHSPWDPDRLRVADAAVVAELRRLGRLRDRFRRGAVVGGPAPPPPPPPPIREVVAPYEAALEDLRRDLKAKEAEVEGLKEKLRGCSTTTPRGSGIINGRKGKLHYSKRVGCITGLGTPAAATPELFESCMDEVKSASKSFTAYLLSLMRAARWDIASTARSIIEYSSSDDPSDHQHSQNQLSIPAVDPAHAKHAMESYVTRKIFHGFENETFYIDGSLSSLLHPADFRRDCLAQFRDMRAMDPAEILGILPTCHFGKFAAKKYLSIVHPKMEESLFGGLEQRRQVLGGAHPRTGFYGEYLRLAKAVWLLHLLAFAMDPSPSHFEAIKGAEFHSEYMESVGRCAGGRVPVGGGMVVGFPVGPGFKLGNGSVVRARVYLVPQSPGRVSDRPKC